jgi:hypothetical protein
MLCLEARRLYPTKGFVGVTKLQPVDNGRDGMAAALRNAVRKSLRVGMIPADGIGREVLPVRSSVIFRVKSYCD